MASFNLLITYPDGEGPRIIAALKNRYGVTTQAEAIEAFRKGVVLSLREIVLMEERDAAVAAAQASVVPVTPS